MSRLARTDDTDLFWRLDPHRANPPIRAPRPGLRRSPLLRAWTAAALPVLAVVAAVALVAASGLVQQDLLGTPLEPYAFGFFVDRYPLFAFVIVYGIVRILVVAGEPGRRRWLRVLALPLAVALLAALCLYPTFGGLVLRAGFMTTSGAFLNNTPLWLAMTFGSLAAGLTFALGLGLASILARLRMRFSRRAWGWALLSGMAGFWGALVLAFAPRLGFAPAGAWPVLPLATSAVAWTASLLALALIPHTILIGWRRAAQTGRGYDGSA